jgi:hypothetical protein
LGALTISGVVQQDRPGVHSTFCEEFMEIFAIEPVVMIGKMHDVKFSALPSIRR